MKMRYRPGLPLVLKGLSVDIPAGTTCGVVGRTGEHASGCDMWLPEAAVLGNICNSCTVPSSGGCSSIDSTAGNSRAWGQAPALLQERLRVWPHGHAVGFSDEYLTRWQVASRRSEPSCVQ